MKLLPAPPGLEYIEIHDGDVYRSAVLVLAYHPQWGVVPLGMGDTVNNKPHKPVLVLPDGRVECAGVQWPNVEAFIASRAEHA